MKLNFQELRQLCPDVSEELLCAHLERLDANYFAVFSPDQVKAHLERLARLTPDNPIEALFESGEGNEIGLTVLAYDYPGEFSLITGVLSAMGFNILSGNVFTYKHARPGVCPEHRNVSSARSALRNPTPVRRMIIDRFTGVVRTDQSSGDWESKFVAAIREVIAPLEKGASGGMAEARQTVNEMVAARLAGLDLPPASVLYPVGIEVSDGGNYTRLSVLAQDTPSFLYALSSAMALQGLSIEQVRINTVEGRVQDEIDILDARGQKITQSAQIDKIKIAVLLTKQFTYFLGSSPDPYAALCRFEKMLESVLAVPDRNEWIELLSTPDALQELARLLGTSDYVWEDFIRLQYETLLPILKPAGATRRFATPPDEFEKALSDRLAKTVGFEAQCRVLNEFKDRELFLIDMEQILSPGIDVKIFSGLLTGLAEVIVRGAAGIIFGELRRRFGIPRTVAGIEAQWTIFGLGKFGGVALGYASDIELLVVFSDNGRTDGANVIENSEYFGQAARMLKEVVKAKREGIFHVDIRLRPYGESGPLSCSLESFCRYYGPKGAAHSYERLALVRLRAVAGDDALGRRIERLRDEFIYGSQDIRPAELRELREKQVAEKITDGRYNAKFSPGALVDLEYDIQLLQVMHGAGEARLRTPRIHQALEALSGLGVLTVDEGKRLAAAYYFFRRLINGLRMLRGSARDLSLPREGSLEFVHLARRMGYLRGDRLAPEQQLRIDFETRTAEVRAFVERHFGRDSLPGKPEGNVADLILSSSVSPALRAKILSAVGFINPERAYTNLRELCGGEVRQDFFAPFAVLVCDNLRQSLDPDMALNNWERYARASPGSSGQFELLMAQPKRLEILLGIFAASQFLADTLIRNPEFFNWVTAPEVINRPRPREVIESDLAAYAGNLPHGEWLDAIRRFRCREILRIGARDICLHAPIYDITADLSSLAGAMVQAALDHFWRESGVAEQESIRFADCFSVLAFGKLGGRELNYSSDIDLLGIYDADCFPGNDGGNLLEKKKKIFYRAIGQVGNYLSAHTTEGHAYRVDFRLRPYGRAGQLAYSLTALEEYYRAKAALWEIQALLKARPIAGSAELGRRFMEMAGKIIRQPRDCKKMMTSIDAMREAGQKAVATGETIVADIKNGSGGIRDIEFLAQGLQLAHGSAIPGLVCGNTLDALALLGNHGLLPPDVVTQLKKDYEFLRRVEHCLQIFEDRQVHVMPDSDDERNALAKRVLGLGVSAVDFLTEIHLCQERVRVCFRTYLACR